MPAYVAPAAVDPTAEASRGEADCMVGQQARRLTRHYALLLVGLAVPLLLLVIALAVQQYTDQRRALLDELTGKARAERIALEPILQAAVAHVQALREFAEDRMSGRLVQAETPLRSALASSRHDNGIEGLFLDRFAGTNEAIRVGNILAMPDLLQRPAAQSRELDMALELFAPMRHGHVAAPQLRWSYYLSASGDFMTMFPFAPSAQLVAQGGYASMQELIGGRLGYDVFRSGTPERNPGAQPYWTGVYQDAGGAGPMVSYAAPVYADGRFAGVIGTDILLGYLTGFLDRIEWPIGGVWIVGQSGDVLAARGHGEPNQVPALPAAFAQLPLSDLLADTGQFRPVGGQLILAESLAGTPFSLLYALPSAELGSLFLPRVKPYALILATLMLTLLAAYILLQRRFVRPALKLVRHIQDESDGGSKPGMVPAPWQPWFAAVSEAFAAGRGLQARLAASEARLKAAAESIPDGLAIFDSDDRLAFHNSRYPEHLTDNARATMALGKRWLDLGAGGRGARADLSSRDGSGLPRAIGSRTASEAWSTASTG